MGWRGVLDVQSAGYYRNIADDRRELQRKIRTVVRGIFVLATNRRMLNPLRYGLLSWQLASHKLCRWLVPFAMIAALGSNAALVSQSPLYFTTFLVQSAFYAAALCGLVAQVPALKIPTFLLRGEPRRADGVDPVRPRRTDCVLESVRTRRLRCATPALTEHFDRLTTAFRGHSSHDHQRSQRRCRGVLPRRDLPSRNARAGHGRLREPGRAERGAAARRSSAITLRGPRSSCSARSRRAIRQSCARLPPQGHEIACHGNGHDDVYRLSPGEFRADIRQAKARIEDVVGDPVTGYRAPNFSIGRGPELGLQDPARGGIPLRLEHLPDPSRPIRQPSAPRVPYEICRDGSASLMEFPIGTARLLGVNLPVGGGGYFRLSPFALTRFGIQDVNIRERRPVMFYLHPWELDPDQPRPADGVASSLPSLRRRQEADRRSSIACSRTSASARPVTSSTSGHGPAPLVAPAHAGVPRRSTGRSSMTIATGSRRPGAVACVPETAAGTWQRVAGRGEPVAPGARARVGHRDPAGVTATIRSTSTAEDDAGGLRSSACVHRADGRSSAPS